VGDREKLSLDVMTELINWYSSFAISGSYLILYRFISNKPKKAVLPFYLVLLSLKDYATYKRSRTRL